MKELKKSLPAGIDYIMPYNPTRSIRAGIEAVIHTLFEAIALVVLVVFLFLQTWRASIIPLLAVPVSIVGTAAALLMLGFSINALSLFGLVLAIGIVVDDAIVVVENVERNIAKGLSPLQATYQAMREVSAPIVAIALVLVSVFLPLAFLGGLTGQFYKQFAVTISISTVISAFNSLTLSPALAALLLKPHGKGNDWLTRGMHKVFGRFFAAFNRAFDRGADNYGRGVAVSPAARPLSAQSMPCCWEPRCCLVISFPAASFRLRTRSSSSASHSFRMGHRWTAPRKSPVRSRISFDRIRPSRTCSPIPDCRSTPPPIARAPHCFTSCSSPISSGTSIRWEPTRSLQTSM